MKDAKAIRERELKAAQEEMNRLKKKAEESRNIWKKHEQDYESTNLEIEELKAGIESGRTQIQAVNELIINLTNEAEELTKQLEEAKVRNLVISFVCYLFCVLYRL